VNTFSLLNVFAKLLHLEKLRRPEPSAISRKEAGRKLSENRSANHRIPEVSVVVTAPYLGQHQAIWTMQSVAPSRHRDSA
jgi:hypothetical protein